jgi:hypothetical protein
VVERFEYSTGMPPLATEQQLVDAAARVGLGCVTRMDLSQTLPWYQSLIRNQLVFALVGAPATAQIIAGLEAMRLLPRGAGRFNEEFVAGTLRAVVEAGRRGLITGSNVLVFQR